MQLSFHWMTGKLSHSEIQKEMTRYDNSTLAKQTVIDWFQFFREFCSEYLKNFPVVIGGPGIVVELRQMLLNNRGYNLCLLFGIEWESCKNFIVRIESGRDESAVLDHVEKHVRVGTVILSDCWLACGADHLPESNNKYTFIHSEDFPKGCVSEAHKEMVDKAWYAFLYEKNHRGDKISCNLFSYVIEFLWKLQFPMEKRFSSFWNQVRLLYPI